MAALRVLIVDDESPVRRGLRMRLLLEPDLDVVGEAGTGIEALDLVGRLQPDVVIMDVRMPGLDGVRATAAIRSAHPAIDVVVLTMHDDVATQHAADAAGAFRLVAKHLVDEALVPTLLELVARRASPADA